MEVSQITKKDHSPIPRADNPPRVSEPVPHLSAGRILIPQRYLVGWPDGVIKVGHTWHGRKRWGRFTATGGQLLELANYQELGDALRGEVWLQHQLEKQYRPAFQRKEGSLLHLGPSGGGWMECFRAPTTEWPAILELAAS